MKEVIMPFITDNIDAIKRGSSIVVAIALVVGSIWAVPSYIATAAELKAVDNKVKVLAESKVVDKQIFNIELQTQLNKQSIRALKSNLADVEDKPTKSNTDLVKKERILREIAEIQNENAVLQNQKFELERRKHE